MNAIKNSKENFFRLYLKICALFENEMFVSFAFFLVSVFFFYDVTINTLCAQNISLFVAKKTCVSGSIFRLVSVLV